MSSAHPVRPSGVDFHFDIMCPYAYQTSLWIRNVRDETGLDIRWRFFSLEEINRAGREEAPVGARLVLRLVDDAHRGPAAPPGHGPPRPVVRRSRTGTPRGRAQAPPPRGGRGHPGRDGTRPGPGRRGHRRPDHRRRGQAEHERWWPGADSACRRLVFDDDQMLFGPVLVDPPEGEAAVRLWDLTTGWLEFPHVYEVQRPEVGPADIDAIATAFSSYLEARDWFSVQNPTP